MRLFISSSGDDEDDLRRDRELARKAYLFTRSIMAAWREMDSTAVIYYDHAAIIMRTVETDRFTGGSNDR